MKRAVFLDRDGVIVQDIDLLTRPDQVRLLPGVPAALSRLRQAGFFLCLVTNQPVVARGLISESELDLIHGELQRRLRESGAGALDAVYSCPHHPLATLEQYRVLCSCRKPRPGMLLTAAKEHGLDLERSFLVGDRLSDIAAGKRAGCRSVLVRTGKHTAPPIHSPDPVEPNLQPDRTCEDLTLAADWLLAQP